MEILNDGNHYNATTGEYVVPYDGLYQFTVAFQAVGDKILKFTLMVNGTGVAYMGNEYKDHEDKSVIMTRNLYLYEDDVVSLDVEEMDKVYGNEGFESWFTGHLIYADNIYNE